MMVLCEPNPDMTLFEIELVTSSEVSCRVVGGFIEGELRYSLWESGRGSERERGQRMV
jgi:hypothetical protein